MIVYILVILMIIQGARSIYHVETLGRKSNTIFLFENVIYCRMQSCSFWHGGNSIMGISLDEQPIQMAELISIQNEHKDLYKNSFLDRGITYIALRIEINSGDTLLIICECIDYNVV